MRFHKVILFVWLAFVVCALSDSSPDPLASSNPYPDPYANAFADADADAEPSANPSPYPEPYAFANADPSADPYADPGLLSSMFERGEALVRQFMPTGLSIAGAMKNFIPTPENIFGLSKHLMLELPQDMVLYAVQAFCKYLYLYT